MEHVCCPLYFINATCDLCRDIVFIWENNGPKYSFRAYSQFIQL